MKKYSLELPKYRLQLRLKLIKRRKPLVEEPFVPTPSVIRRKYRSGTLLGKIVRHISSHKSAKKFFAANLSAAVIAGAFLPTTQGSIQAANMNTQPDEAVIQTQNTLTTEKSIQYPLETVRINQNFSFFHPGVDLGAKIGDPIKAIKAGNVIEAGYAKDGYGNTVVIDHGQGLTSRYAHLSKIETKVGDIVTTNTEIGQVGITGHSTGPHLHLEIRQNGIPLNPISVLSR
jgi:murein DD-endopeptidase MepM/ murein hydrolase activator NlpD